MALIKSLCLITLLHFLSTTLEQAEAGALKSWGWPWRDPVGIHKVFKKHNQLNVWEQRPGGDVNYYLTSLLLDFSTSQVRSIYFPVQIWNLTQLLMFSSPYGSRKYIPHLLKDTSHPVCWIIHLFSILSSVEKIVLLHFDSFAPSLSKELENWGVLLSPSHMSNYRTCRIVTIIAQWYNNNLIHVYWLEYDFHSFVYSTNSDLLIINSVLHCSSCRRYTAWTKQK